MPDKSAAGAAAPLHHLRKVPAQNSSSAPNAAATHKKAPILLLASYAPRSYNTEFVDFYCERGAVSITMDKFEEFGRRIDEELTRLRNYIDKEVAPETEKRTATFLREVSEKFTQFATKLESRTAARAERDAQKPPSQP